MVSNYRRVFVFTVWGLTAGMALTYGVAEAFHVRYNATHSMGRGLWQDDPAGRIEAGSVVRVCSPVDTPYLHRGRCPDGSMELLKRIVAVEGDNVTLDHNGVTVNGRTIPKSAPLPNVSGLPYFPHGTYRLTGLWLAGESSDSFDSRYFGPVSRHQVLAVVKPLFILHD